MRLAPISPEASQTAWVLLACSIGDDSFVEHHVNTKICDKSEMPDPKATDRAGYFKGKVLHQNTCGVPGYQPDDRAFITMGRSMDHWAGGGSTLGGTPSEFTHRGFPRR